MSKPGIKYTAIITTARDLFWKHGFRRVTIEEICRKAGVSKMTYYKHFPNKVELAKTIYDNVIEDSLVRFRIIMESNDTPDEKMRKVMLMKLEGTNNISPEFMNDFYAGGEPELKAYVEKRIREVWEALKGDYIKAQENGIFRKDLNIELFIRIQFRLIDLVNDPELAGIYRSPQDLIMEFARLLVYGIIEHRICNEK